MWCDAACDNAAGNWAQTLLASSDQSISAVDLVIDSTNRPQLSLAFSNNDPAQRGIYHIRCVTNCETDDGTWESSLLDATETLNEREPVADTGICSNPTNPTWGLGWTTSLALDSQDRAQIAYDARHMWTCYSGTNIRVERDINWVRFAGGL